jgi:hypothetical protein
MGGFLFSSETLIKLNPGATMCILCKSQERFSNTLTRSINAMRTKIPVMVVAVILVLLATAWSADINGTWKGSMDMMGQSMELSFTFKVDGAELTGTSIGPQGNEYPISEGKITGDDISFVVEVTGQMEMKINYKGKIVGDEIKLTMQMDMGGMGGGPPGGGMGGPPAGGGGPGGGPGGGMGAPPELVLKKVE